LRVVGFFPISSILIAQTSDWSGEDNSKFAKLSKEFIREMLALSPSSASHTGYRQHVDPKTGKIVALVPEMDSTALIAR
jgi:hypothetical protein